jgi:hypothetical protein
MLIYPENEKPVFADVAAVAVAVAVVAVVVVVVLEPYSVSIVVDRNSDLYNQNTVVHLTVLKQNHDVELKIAQNHE